MGEALPAGPQSSFRQRETLFTRAIRRVARVRRSFCLWAVLPAAVCVWLIWYPFGFSLGGMIEEWDLLHVLGMFPGAWNSFPGNPMSGQYAARPFQLTVYYLAHAIDPHSFLGFHIVLMSSCFLRVIAGAWIGRFLFRSRVYAAALGMLFLVFPADTQQISFRTFNISLASTLMVCGGVMTLSAFSARRRAMRAIAIVAAVALSCIATLIYEGVALLYALAPLLLYVRLGGGAGIALIRRRRGIAATWAIGPILNGAYLAYALVVVKSGYQLRVLRVNPDGSLLSAIADNAHYVLTSAAYRAFYDGWNSSWEILAHEVTNWTFFGGVALAIVGMLLLPIDGIGGRSRKYLLRCALAGLVIALLGYLPFISSRNFVYETQRTFISVAPGASIVIISMILFLSGSVRVAGVAVASLLVFLGMVAQLYQHDQYARLYTGVIRPYMAYVADKVDLSKKVHLVEDASGIGGYLNGMFVSKVAYGPASRLDDFVGQYFLCMDGMPSRSRIFQRCELREGVWILRGYDGAELHFSAGDVDEVEVGKEFDASYQAKDSRWRDLGSFSQDASVFASPPKDSYRCVVDSTWGYSRFCRGEGWSDGTPFQSGFRHQSYLVPLEPRVDLLFRLDPAPEDYTLRGQFLLPPLPDLLARLELSVNGHPIQFEAERASFRADVSRQYLLAGLNEIAFSNAVVGDAKVVLVTGVELAPNSRPASIAAGAEIPEIPVDRWLAAPGDQGYAMLGPGFSGAEPDGVWTDGEVANMRFKLPGGKVISSLVLEARPYLDESHTHFDADFVVNGELMLHRSFASPARFETIEIPVDKARIPPDGVIKVRLQIAYPSKPPTADRRDLGLFLRRFRIQ
ncbi:MAG: hypothetical protein P4M07_17970 [Xanthobacteraceae bacterium]|nr:hypothetical protein [Xanthobacteraceae bacterium]